ncbi:hypothetical protein [Streptomyces sp. NPDC004266]|uniref:hypothetical protein n=1 Tax=Streptomyces sp. NPDC004266 TaxID=3364693 RepID=UPI0036B09F42
MWDRTKPNGWPRTDSHEDAKPRKVDGPAGERGLVEITPEPYTSSSPARGGSGCCGRLQTALVGPALHQVSAYDLSSPVAYG